jgi:hypothetical protein
LNGGLTILTLEYTTHRQPSSPATAGQRLAAPSALHSVYGNVEHQDVMIVLSIIGSRNRSSYSIHSPGFDCVAAGRRPLVDPLCRADSCWRRSSQPLLYVSNRTGLAALYAALICAKANALVEWVGSLITDKMDLKAMEGFAGRLALPEQANPIIQLKRLSRPRRHVLFAVFVALLIVVVHTLQIPFYPTPHASGRHRSHLSPDDELDLRLDEFRSRPVLDHDHGRVISRGNCTSCLTTPLIKQVRLGRTGGKNGFSTPWYGTTGHLSTPPAFV